MKINKRMWLVLTSILVVTLSAFAVKNDAVWNNDSAETAKETVGSSEIIASQPTLTVNALTTEEADCRHVSHFTPNEEMSFTAEGGTFSARVTYTPYRNQTAAQTRCSLIGVNVCTIVDSTKRINSDYTNPYTGKPELVDGYNAVEVAKFVCKPNTTSSDLVEFVWVAGRQIPVRVTVDKADFNLFNWIRQKAIETSKPPCMTPQCLYDRRGTVTGVRG